MTCLLLLCFGASALTIAAGVIGAELHLRWLKRKGYEIDDHS